ncbi:hypothetical protein BS78_08G132000 [Paspalum vaginatum]|nr:hypothetical protein BS78_08G132000 [Paspalum vaginatum]
MHVRCPWSIYSNVPTRNEQTYNYRIILAMENTHLAGWPDVIVPVETLSDTGIPFIPQQYIRPLSERPSVNTAESDMPVKIPIIDLAGFTSDEESHKRTLEAMTDACQDWGFFQVVNHGVDLDDVKRMKQVWREFFDLPMEQKKLYANSPVTYEGYGSRIGVDKAAILDWSDYYFLNLLPTYLKNMEKWPKVPYNLRDVTEKYTSHMMNLSNVLLKAISNSLQLDEQHLHMAFGGSDDMSANIRVTYYPKCPQPELTLGLSPHTDIGGLTLLLLDDTVVGTQVRKENERVTLQPVPGAFIVNVGDQIQVDNAISIDIPASSSLEARTQYDIELHSFLSIVIATIICRENLLPLVANEWYFRVVIVSNGRYKSAEHRVLANSEKTRVNIAFFCNPGGDLPIAPANKLVSPMSPALYDPITFNEYRNYTRTKGLNVREQIKPSKVIQG